MHTYSACEVHHDGLLSVERVCAEVCDKLPPGELFRERLLLKFVHVLVEVLRIRGGEVMAVVVLVLVSVLMVRMVRMGMGVRGVRHGEHLEGELLRRGSERWGLN